MSVPLGSEDSLPEYCLHVEKWDSREHNWRMWALLLEERSQVWLSLSFQHLPLWSAPPGLMSATVGLWRLQAIDGTVLHRQ